MAPTHDPLTEQHHAVLVRAPFEITIAEQTKSPDNAAIHFLHRLGYLKGECVHVGAEATGDRWRFERTAKPLP